MLSESKQEVRGSRRQKTLKRIKIAFSDGYCVSEGMMKNVSDTGALIILADGILVPDRFVLRNDIDGYEVDCKIVHRKGQKIGVKFNSEKRKIQASRMQVVTAIR